MTEEIIDTIFATMKNRPDLNKRQMAMVIANKHNIAFEEAVNILNIKVEKFPEKVRNYFLSNIFKRQADL